MGMAESTRDAWPSRSMAGGRAAAHPRLRRPQAAIDVAPSDHEANLGAGCHGSDNVAGDGGEHVEIDAVPLVAGERLARQLEQDAPVAKALGRCRPCHQPASPLAMTSLRLASGDSRNDDQRWPISRRFVARTLDAFAQREAVEAGDLDRGTSRFLGCGHSLAHGRLRIGPARLRYPAHLL